VHVIGASAGGIIAMHAALLFPGRFASLALYAATPGINPERPAKGNCSRALLKAACVSS
jgi:pimeloyl-ACP methyl ester carboxylesterase